jgi:DNA-directed RNA polymerase specialized sigma24 family protein
MESETERIALGLRQQDVALLEKLVERYQYRLVRYLVSLLGKRDGVDDLVQETWLRVLERGKSYDGCSRFEPWLFTVARNITLDAWTRMRRMLFAQRLRPVSLRLTHSRRARKMPSGLLTRSKLWSLSFAKPSCCVFRKT